MIVDIGVDGQVTQYNVLNLPISADATMTMGACDVADSCLDEYTDEVFDEYGIYYKEVNYSDGFNASKAGILEVGNASEVTIKVDNNDTITLTDSRPYSKYLWYGFNVHPTEYVNENAAHYNDLHSQYPLSALGKGSSDYIPNPKFNTLKPGISDDVFTCPLPFEPEGYVVEVRGLDYGNI